MLYVLKPWLSESLPSRLDDGSVCHVGLVPTTINDYMNKD